MTTYAVIGAGAIGCFYGAHLARAGNDVHFLFRRDAEAVRSQGLTIRSDDGDFTLESVNVHASWETIPGVDVAVVAVKAQANEDVAGRLASILTTNGSVLLIQNGLDGEQTFAEAVGPAHPVLGGVATIACERTGPATVDHFALGQLTVGQYVTGYAAAGITDLMQRISDDLTAGGVPVQLAEDLLLARWMKLVWNIPFNSLSVILRATTDELIADDAALELIKSLMQEVKAAALAEGRHIPQEFLDGMLAATYQLPAYSTSMKVDFDAGRPMEIEGLIGGPLRHATAAGATMPATEVIYRELRFLAARLQG